MRKVILGVGISLDGYIARPDGGVDFLFMPKDYSMGPFFKSIDTALMGRKTYEVALKMGGGFGGSMRHYVFSRTLPSGERDGITFTSKSPTALVAGLRRSRGKHIWLMGGGELVRDFLKADLVDELYIGVLPVLIGEGIPLFPPGFPQRNFALEKNESSPAVSSPSPTGGRDRGARRADLRRGHIRSVTAITSPVPIRMPS